MELFTLLTSYIEEKRRFEPNNGYDKILQILPDLLSGKSKQVQLGDMEARKVFVPFQHIMEEFITTMLTSNKIQGAVATIHTPLPSTPLRNANHPRFNILRNFMDRGGILVSLYDAQSYELAREAAKDKNDPDINCSPTQIDILEQTKNKYGERLSLHPLKADSALQLDLIDKLNGELSGATYLIKDNKGTEYLFSIRSYQLSQETGKDRRWGLWLGTRQQTQDRWDEIKNLTGNFDIDIESALEKSQQIREVASTQNIHR